jgi:glycosyltransferase involved in cell wall biosynthesis
MNDYLVDVVLITYNQEEYVEKALLSVLEQVVDFKFRILIGEDYSSDRTRNIVLEYEKKYPEKIKVIKSDKNVGAQANVVRTIAECKMKYIACLEGDDYWCDPYKLQKQVNFMENNEGYIACCSNVFERRDFELKRVENNFNIINIKDLLKGNCIYTCSVIYRNIITLPEWYYQCKMGDWILWLLLAKRGPFYNFREPMAVYRIHQNGIWIGKGKETNLKDIIATYNILLTNMEPKYYNELKNGAKQYYRQLLGLLSTKRTNRIFYWTYNSLKFDFDFRWFKYLARYFINYFDFKANSQKS